MNVPGKITRIVCDYYEARILCGCYRTGDSLPSISRICSTFHLAPDTVRTALMTLQKNGYIKIEERKAAQVTYEADSAKIRRSAAQYFVPRKEGILDLAQAGKLLFEPLWEEGLYRWNDAQWDLLRHNLIQPTPGEVALPVEFYILSLSALNNELILNLYWEMINYIRFPYLANPEKPKQAFPNMKGQPKDKILSFLAQKFTLEYEIGANGLFSFIDQARLAYGLTNVKPIPFCWNIYRQRPQLRYTLSSLLIREIINGKYPAGTYLPSIVQLARQFDVSVDTIRRTLCILSNLGITESCQGKGTLVCIKAKQINFNQTDIQEGIKFYGESLQLLALTIRQVSEYTLTAVTTEKRQELLRKFESIEKDKSYLCFEIFLTFIKQECPLATVRECYGKLLELIAWGYPFALQRLERHCLHDKYSEPATQMIQAIKAENFNQFSLTWRNLMEREEQEFRTIFTSN